MNIDRSKHNKYTASAVYGNQTTGGITTDEVGNVTGTGLQYSGNIIYVGGGGGGSIDPALLDKMINQNAYSYMNISNGTYTVNASAKQEKDYINLNIVGDNETVDTEVSKDRYLNRTLFDATGLKGGRYGVSYKKVLVPGEEDGEPVEIPKWVITLEKISGAPIFSQLDFNGVSLFNGNTEVGVYSIDNPRVTVNQDDVTGLVSIIISNTEPLDFTELRIIKAGDYIDTSTFSNIAIISNIVIQEFITVTITQAGATKYWQLDDQGKLYTTYDTYTTKSLGAYDKIWTNYGYTVGNYVQGISGGAFYIVDQLQNTYLEVDKLKVRKKAYFETLEIINVNSVGGKQIISPAGAITINKVEDKGTYYRCYFLGTQDGVEVENRFKSNDLAFSQNFNIKKPGEYEQVANHYFWRKVNAVSVEPDASGNHWIDLDKTDCDTDSDIPHINDVVAQLGNKTDTDRQSAMIFSSVDAESPRIILCHGINTYSLSSKEYFDLGVNHLTNQAYMNVYGNSFVGARDGSTYVKYTQADGLQIKGSISASSTYGGKSFSEVFVTTENFDDSVKAVIGDDLEYLQNQIDGNIESYFYEYSPTISNYPANTWTTEADKQRHNGDTFTNIQKFVDDVTTPDAGKSWRWVKNASNVWGWTIISDSDAVLALKKAGQAQDTADGKRRVFTKKPETTDVYDIGDLWVNATYIDTVGLIVYSNDLLRARKAKIKGIAFNIVDWELASKYTDDTLAQSAKALAEAAQKAADDAGKAAGAAQDTIDDYKGVIDDVFQDGVITASEKNRLNSLKDTVNTTLFYVQTTYNRVYNNANLADKVQKTRLKTAYDAFSSAATALVNAVTSILSKVNSQGYSVTKGDIATIDTAYVNFNIKYKDYVGALGDANLEITNSISSTAYTNAVNKYAWLNGLFDPDQVTTIEGGVVTTGVLALGKTTSGIFKVNAGINGASNSAYLGSGPAIWFGGDMLDKDNYSAGNRPANVATSMFRFDGSGYLGYKPTSVVAKDQAPIWWDATGNIHANPLSFFVGEETVGLLLASFQAVDSEGDGKVDYIIPKVPFAHLQIGNGYLGYDAANNSIYVYVLDDKGIKQICNFYSYGEISAYGASSGGDVPTGAQYLDELKDVQFTSLKASHLMQYNGTKWVNIDPSVIKINSLGDIADVTLTSIATNDIIKWDGTKWVNTPYGGGGSSAWEDITGKPTTLSGYGITDALPLTGGTVTGYLEAPNFTANVNGVHAQKILYLPDSTYSVGATTRPRFGRFNRADGSVVLQLGNGNTFDIIDSAWSRTIFHISEPTSSIIGTNNESLSVQSTASNGAYIGYVTAGTHRAQSGWHESLGAFLQYTQLANSPTLCVGRIDTIQTALQLRYINTFYNVLHAGNYNSYSPSLTGSGASGTWNINISGNAISAYDLVVNNTEVKNDARFQYFQKSVDTTIMPDTGWWSLLRSQHGGYVNGYWQEIAQSFASDTVKFRRNVNGTLYAWKTFAWIDSNVASATQLLNTRTIWGQPFNGTADIPISAVAAMPYLHFKNYNDNSVAGYVGRGSSSNNAIYLSSYNNNPIIIDAGTNYVQINNVLNVNPSVIGNFNEGIRLYGAAKSATWSNIQFGCDPAANVGSHSYQWLLGRDANNNFLLSRGSADGANGFVVTTTGNMGIGVTNPTYRLTVNGIILATNILATLQSHSCVQIGGGYYSNWNTSGADTWVNVLEPIRAIFNSNNIAVAANTTRNIIGWADNINGVGYTTRYSITSGRAASVWGTMRLSVGNSDAGNSGHQLALGGSGAMTWTGSMQTNGIYTSVSNGITSTFGALNSSYCHIYTTAPLFYMDKGLSAASLSSRGGVTANTVELSSATPFIDFHFGSSTADYTSRIIESASGRLQITSKLSIGYVNDTYALATGSFICASWIRTTGDTGWYNEKWGGGIHMIDNIYIRTYNDKKFHIANGSFDALNVYGGVYSSGVAGNGLTIIGDESTTTRIKGRIGSNINAAINSYEVQWYANYFRMNVHRGGSTDIAKLSYYYNNTEIASLSMGGNFVVSGEVTAYSDIRLKSNISNLSFRGKLNPKTYIKDGKQSIGFIAQEVQQLYPELVMIGNDENHYLSLNYGCITAVLSSQINKVEDEVYVLKNRVKQLEDKLKVYESRVSALN